MEKAKEEKPFPKSSFEKRKNSVKRLLLAATTTKRKKRRKERKKERRKGRILNERKKSLRTNHVKEGRSITDRVMKSNALLKMDKMRTEIRFFMVSWRKVMRGLVFRLDSHRERGQIR